MRPLRFHPFLVALFAGLAVGVGCTSQYAITHPIRIDANAPLILCVAPIELALPLDTLESQKPRPEEVLQLEHFIQADLVRTGFTVRDRDSGRPVPFRVEGSILEFRRGAGVVRFFVGFGLGNAKTVARLKLVEASTGRVVFAGNFTGIVSGWSYGEDALRRVASMFARELMREMQAARNNPGVDIGK